jgi:hypothetical protein
MLTLLASVIDYPSHLVWVKIDPVDTYNSLKIHQIWHQNDQEFMAFHSIYDPISFSVRNQK